MAIDKANRDVVGAAIGNVRAVVGWTQAELGARVGQTQGWISRVENGRCDSLTFETAERLLGAMGARLVVTVDAPYLGDRQRQRDPAHSRMSAHVTSQLARGGWQVATEVEIGGDRSRGWIDVLAYHAASGLLLVIELKTEIHDLGQIQRSLGWYEREAWKAARRFGWRPRQVVGCLLLLATDANDIRATENRDVLGVDFRGRARDLDEVVAARLPSTGSSRCIAMVDPRSRRRAWLRPLRIDGRRVRAPYRDYADFMRATADSARSAGAARAAKALGAPGAAGVVGGVGTARAPTSVTRPPGPTKRPKHSGQ